LRYVSAAQGKREGEKKGKKGGGREFRSADRHRGKRRSVLDEAKGKKVPEGGGAARDYTSPLSERGKRKKKRGGGGNLPAFNKICREKNTRFLRPVPL